VAGELGTSFGPGPVHRLVARLPLAASGAAHFAAPVEAAPDARRASGRAR
jgi:hypothetical protein